MAMWSPLIQIPIVIGNIAREGGREGEREEGREGGREGGANRQRDKTCLYCMYM